MMQSKICGAVLCMAFLALTKPCLGLSWELCDSYGSEWVTGSPHLEGKFPFYSLIFSCTGESAKPMRKWTGLFTSALHGFPW